MLAAQQLGPVAAALRGAGGPGVRLGFAEGLMERDGRRHATLDAVPGVTFGRVGAGLAQEADGRWRPFATGRPRITGRGLLIEGQRTNKVACRNAAPVDLTGVVRTGDAAATLALVDDTAALRAAGLGELIDAGVTTGRVLYLDNRAGTALAQVRLPGPVGDLTDHAVSLVWRGGGQGRFGTTQTFGSYEALEGGYVRRAKIANGLTQATRVFGLDIQAGAEVWFILMQMEDGARATSPIVTADAAATRGTDALTLALPSATEMCVSGEVEFTGDAVADQTLIDLHDDDAGRLIVRRLPDGRLAAEVRAGGVTASLGSVARAGARVVRWAVSRAGSGWTFVADGVLVGTASVAAPALKACRIGALRGGSAPLDGYVRRLAFEPAARTIEELRERTA